MLFAVRRFLFCVPALALRLLALVSVLGMQGVLSAAQQNSASPSNPQAAQQQTSPSQSASPGQPAPQSAPAYNGPVIVLDPAHGGTDTGARGESGAIEKDLVLDYARMVRSELESQGIHVMQTRNDDSNPSYADRAAVANAYRNAIFISLHVSSTGPFGTAQTYYYKFGSAPNGPPGALDASSRSGSSANSLVTWDDAQMAYDAVSHSLADTLQAQLAQRFSGSPTTAGAAAVRELRSVDAPAVAIEISSVSVQDPNTLTALAAPLAVSIARGLEAFRATTSPKAN